jgi:Uma2 family endonuclease
MVGTMTEPPTRTRRWKRVEYERLVECGIFRPGEPLELLGGLLVVAEPQGSAHFTAIRLVEEALRTAFGAGWDVRSQGPIALDDESEPEPDVAVVPGSARDYRDAHPASPVLVVEVAESSLAIDREHKGSLYARAALPEYWILNLVSRVLEVYRDPAPEPSAAFGWRYRSVDIVGPDGLVSPLAAPAAHVAVADLLP